MFSVQQYACCKPVQSFSLGDFFSTGGRDPLVRCRVWGKTHRRTEDEAVNSVSSVLRCRGQLCLYGIMMAVSALHILLLLWQCLRSYSALKLRKSWLVGIWCWDFQSVIFNVRCFTVNKIPHNWRLFYFHWVTKRHAFITDAKDYYSFIIIVVAVVPEEWISFI